MNRNLWVSTILTGALSLSAGLLRAQEGAAQPPRSLEQGRGPGGRGPGGEFGGPLELLGFGGMRGGKVVKGVPFTAVAVSVSTRTLADGNHITQKTQTNLFRDSQGRVRKEVTLPATGPLAASGQPKSLVILIDPVAGTNYMLDVQNKIAWKMPSHSAGAAKDETAGNSSFRHQRTETESNATAEDMGAQTIGGLSAQGTRHTNTIPAGQIGNEKPISSTFEEWYSNDLQMVVMTKRSDPRFGDSTYTVSNVQRQEPAASLFVVPADYTMKEGSGHLGGGHHHHGPPPAAAPAPSN
jgi:hypothetical protein